MTKAHPARRRRRLQPRDRGSLHAEPCASSTSRCAPSWRSIPTTRSSSWSTPRSSTGSHPRNGPSSSRLSSPARSSTPPAGVVGRGDAFILKIAQRAGAIVLSNDSFQEFHAEHPWLFEEGRLVGGKPVPRVGWIFTARNPVRGQKSKAATTKAARAATAAKAPAAKEVAAKEVAAKDAPSPAAVEHKPRAVAAKRSGRSAATEAPRVPAKRGAKATVEPRANAPPWNRARRRNDAHNAHDEEAGAQAGA